MSEPNTKWKLHAGLHRGTVMSRDAAVYECDSLDGCRRTMASLQLEWASMGCYVWFADAKGPNGESVRIHKGTPYW